MRNKLIFSLIILLISISTIFLYVNKDNEVPTININEKKINNNKENSIQKEKIEEKEEKQEEKEVIKEENSTNNKNEIKDNKKENVVTMPSVPNKNNNYSNDNNIISNNTANNNEISDNVTEETKEEVKETITEEKTINEPYVEFYSYNDCFNRIYEIQRNHRDLEINGFCTEVYDSSGNIKGYLLDLVVHGVDANYLK